MDIEKAENHIIEKLRTGLAPTLFYHGLHHTLDVTHAALVLADEENITDADSLILLKTAALYHDSGFLNTYKGHEEEGCRIAREQLLLFGYSSEQMDIVCGMIMATKIPQSAKDPLERILCDADLDYLGRADFEPIALSLYRELKARNMIANEKTWNAVQVQFLESHQYHTRSARNKRESAKQQRLAELRKLI